MGRIGQPVDGSRCGRDRQPALTCGFEVAIKPYRDTPVRQIYNFLERFEVCQRAAARSFGSIPARASSSKISPLAGAAIS